MPTKSTTPTLKPASKAATRLKAATKSDLYGTLAAATNLSRKQIASMFDAYAVYAKKELGKRSPGVVLLPGIGKLKATRLAATKATTKPNPFKAGEMMTIKAKPARIKIKLSLSKAWRESI